MKEDFDLMLQYACQALGVSMEDVRCGSEAQECVAARAMTVYWIKNRYKHITWKQIGKFMGGFDHSSMFHLYKRMEDDYYGVMELVPEQVDCSSFINLTYDLTPRIRIVK